MNPGDPDIERCQREAGQAFAAAEYARCEQLLRVAIAAHPGHAPFRFNLALTLEKLEQRIAAVSAYSEALSLSPIHLGALRNLPHLLRTLKRVSEALTVSRQGCDLYPGDAALWRNLGQASLALGHFSNAYEAYERAVQIDSGAIAESRIGLGLALAALGQVGRADDVFAACRNELPNEVKRLQGALQLESGESVRFDGQQAWLSFSYERQRRCDWEGRENYIAGLEQLIDDSRPLDRAVSFHALALGISEERLQKLNRAAAKSLSKKNPQSLSESFTSSGQIRIAYLSHNFREHPTAHLSQRIYGLHDRKHFEVFCYALNEDDGGPMRRRIRADADHFIDLCKLSPAEAAQRIRADGIQVLVGLGGYQEGQIVDVMMQRAAPLQVNYLSYQGTLGGDAADYHITDTFSTPAAQQPYWDERLVLLPDCHYAYNDCQAFGQTVTRQESSLPEHALVLCAFNNGYKIEPKVFGVWCALLKDLPQAVLWMYESYERQSEFIKAEAVRRGIDPARIIFAKSAPIPDHLARLQLADIFLDTFQYNAHTTMLDALYAGVPAVSLAGQNTVARIGASILKSAGLEAYVTTCVADYRQRVLTLAADPQERASIRRHLRTRRGSAPPFDMPQLVARLETTYKAIWYRYKAGLAPETLFVKD